VRRVKTTAALWLLAITVAGCQVFGVPAADTFNKKWAAAVTAVTVVRQQAETLLVARKINADDAQNVQYAADESISGLLIAQDLYEVKPEAGEARLNTVINALALLQRYLEERGAAP